MPVSVSHVLTATTPDNPAYEIRPSHWNSNHAVTLSATAGTEIFGAFSNDAAYNVSFSTNAGGQVVASANVTAAPSPVNVTGENGSSVNAQTIAFLNSNGLTLGVSTAANGASVTGSHNGLTTAAASNHSHGNPTLNLTNLSGTTGSNSAGFTLSLSAAAPFVAGVSTGGNTAGDTGVTGTRVVFVGSNNVTLSQATGAAGATVTIQGANTSAQQTGISGVIASDATYTSGTISFSNQNGVTIGSSVNGASQYVRLSVATSYRASNDAVGLNTAKTNVTWTVNSSGISLNAGGYAGTGTSATNATFTLDSNGLALSIAAPGGAGYSAGVSNVGNTAGNTGLTGSNLVLSGGNGVSLSQSTHANGATVGFSVNTSYRASNDAIGLNTAKTNVTWTVNSSGLSLDAGGYAGTATAITGKASITLNSGGLSFNGAGLAGTTSGFTGANISASITHNTDGLAMSMSVAAPGAAAENNAINLLGNNTAGNTTATGSTIGWSGINLTLSGTNNSVVNISAPATSSLVGTSGISVSTNGSTISVMQVGINGWEPYRDNDVIASSLGNGTLQLNPHIVEAPRVWDRVVIPINNTNSSNSSGSHTLSFYVGLFTQNASTLSLYGSTSSSTAVTHSGTAGSYSLYSGQRLFTIPWTTTAQPGRYWIGVMTRTASGGANGSYSMFVNSQLNSNFLGHFGSAHNTSMQYTLGQGIMSVTTAAMPSAVAFTDIQGSGSAFRRPPVVMFQSGTV